MGTLDGKVAIVTGAARGQGEAEAKLFVSEGAKVMLADQPARPIFGHAGGSARDACIGRRLDHQHLVGRGT